MASIMKNSSSSKHGSSAVRRLSSMTATEEQVSVSGPVAIVPPSSGIDKRSNSCQSFAASLEHDRDELSLINLKQDLFASPLTSSPFTQGTPNTTEVIPSEDSFAFAFDIDGVLIRGGNPIPEAIESMKVLNGGNEFGVKVPYIFLTNGGGKTEHERCMDLSRQLDIEVLPAQFICGHTPMREMVGKYETVLVVGGEGEKCRQVAEEYGFRDVIKPGDIIKDNENTTPFRNLTQEEREKSRKREYGKAKIEAIFVFADSRDWAGDCQIILDLAMSRGGYIGTLSEKFDEGPPIHFSHNDIVWSAAHENVRLGMCALRKVIETLYREVTHGKELNTFAFGKPEIGTFEFATRLLKQWRKDEYRINAPPDTVYFVNDTLESDIRGTNQFNLEADNDWYSILVQTGVFQEGTKPAYRPMATVNTVLDAVRHGMQREFAKKIKKATQNLVAESSAIKEASENDENVSEQNSLY